MATAIGKTIGKAVQKYNNVTSSSTISTLITGPLNKLWRAKILLNRATSSLPKDASLSGSSYNPNNVSGEARTSSKNPTANNELHKSWRLSLQYPRVEEGEGVDPAQGNKNTENYNLFAVPADVRSMNKVIIYNLTTSPYQYIILQNRPESIEFQGETSWASIKSMGRNTPMYHYTGSEDILQFNISWYCDDPDNPKEVINKCRLLERWTKSNGYQAGPPLLKIEWGNSGLFDDHSYILGSATYVLGNFKNASRTRVAGTSCNYTDMKLLPSSATQELIFRRVSAYNLSHGDIVSDEDLKLTKGIQI